MAASTHGALTMARYALHLPTQLKQEAGTWAAQQGISLNQFIVWAVAEKVGALKQQLDDLAFPHITYRRALHGPPVAVLRGTGLRVQTLVIAAQAWGLTLAQIAVEYDIPVAQVQEALAFSTAHREEIDAVLAAEDALEAAAHAPPTPAS
jgi:uncharacterized protein (DUF433 family)